ncbi:hypothetical protein WJX74_010245 [Apatococcus lobatus]|uniref:Crossover junction endonuclease MUS81 n=1 Tax=Apatococcus lobatus TaxID=904363 RepID=A0AAW1RCI7_9CHLO
MGSEAWREAALKAKQQLMHSVTHDHMDCQDPGNMLLLLFVRECQHLLVESGKPSWVKAYGKAFNTIQCHQCRIRDIGTLRSLQNIGSGITSAVSTLWQLYPPEPPSQEELVQEAEVKRQLFMKDQEKKAAQKRAAEAKRAATQTARQSSAAITGQRSAAAELDSMYGDTGPAIGEGGYGSEEEPEEPAGSRPWKKARTKQPKPKKAYAPGYRTAGYAFMVVLFKEHAYCKEFLKKEELIRAAEESGIAQKPIRGNSSNNPNQLFRYEGWNIMSRLVNNNPPLILQWSNPKKLKLTPEGLSMARWMYDRCVASDLTDPLPDHLLAQMPPAVDPNSHLSNPPAAGDSESADARPGGANASQPAGSGTGRRRSSTGSTPAARRRAAARSSQDPDAAGPSWRSGPCHAHHSSAAAPVDLLDQFLPSMHAPAYVVRPSSHRPPPYPNIDQLHAELHPDLQSEVPRRQSKKASRRNVQAAEPQLQQQETQEPKPRTPFRAFRRREPALQQETAWEDLDPEPQHCMEIDGDAGAGPSSELVPNDEDLARLMEMGYSAETAIKLLGNGRSVEEAVEQAVDLGSEDCHSEADTAPLSDQDLDSPGYVDLSGPPEAPVPLHASQQDPIGWSQAIPSQPSLDACCPFGSNGVPTGAQQDAPGAVPVGDKHGLGIPKQEPDAEQPAMAGRALADWRPHSVVPSRLPAASPEDSGTGSGMGGAGKSRVASGLPPKPSGASFNHCHASQAALGSQPPLHRTSSGQPPGPQTSQALSRASSRGGSESEGGMGTGTDDEPEAPKLARDAWQLPSLQPGHGPEEVNVRLPPLSPGACFSDDYQIVLILDQREQFDRSRQNGHAVGREQSRDEYVDRLRRKGTDVEVRHLEGGDAIWIARSRRDPRREWVLDYIVERKNVADLLGSIKSGRYEQQKYWMKRCGLRHLMYLVEGKPEDLAEGCENVKTAAVATEVNDGFLVLRTGGSGDTCHLYEKLTIIMKEKYGKLRGSPGAATMMQQSLPEFPEFKTRLVLAKKMTVRDVWSLMLHSVRGLGSQGVTAIVAKYPTPRALFQKYHQTMVSASRSGNDAVRAAQRLHEGMRLSPSRCMSASMSANIFNHLFANGWQAV